MQAQLLQLMTNMNILSKLDMAHTELSAQQMITKIAEKQP